MKTHTHVYHDDEGDDQEEEKPQLTIIITLLLLVSATVAIAFSAEYLIGSIEGIVKDYELNKTFVGLILFPIVNRAAEVIP